jgi:hypothetical protein
VVQVDVFWAYGIGASFAVAASHQLTTPPRRALLQEPQAVSTLLYCGLLFAPSGAWLLWAFPSWETMQVAAGHSALPAWLVALFAVTNVSQGLLGFWVARRLIRGGRVYTAFLQAGLGYVAMFFILVHGWDGTGYRRFFSTNPGAFGQWQANEALPQIGRWLGSPVALTLYGMGAVLVPVMLALMVRSLREGQRVAGIHRSPAGLAVALVAGILGLALGTAVVASALVNLAGWWIGIPLAAAVTWLVVTRRRTGLAHLLFRRLALTSA